MKNTKESPIDTKKISEILEANNGARIRTWLSICSHCALCAESCFFYLANNKDPQMSPAYKFKNTLGEMYRRKGKVDREFLRNCYNIVWGNAPLVNVVPFTVLLVSILPLWFQQRVLFVIPKASLPKNWRARWTITAKWAIRWE